MDIIELLLNFGLTRQEAMIYITLISQGELTGYEVAKNTGISRSNTYTALAALVEKGAAYILEDTAVRYTPVQLESFCQNKITELQKLKKDILKKAPVQKEETEGYITIRGRKHILNKMRNMLITASERIYLSVSNTIIEDFYEELTGCVQRGLKVVIITNEPFMLEDATVYHAEKHQYQIRLIIDSSKVLTGDILEGDDSTCLYSKKKNLIELFKESMRNEIKLIEITRGE